MSRSLRVSLVQTVRRWLLPLGCYYVVTLAVPFANGAARHGAIFANHALIVLVFPLLLIVLVRACGTFAEACRRTGSALLHSEFERIQLSPRGLIWSRQGRIKVEFYATG